MPDPWEMWDSKVNATGRPDHVCDELNDLEILILLSDDDPRRAVEKQILRQEAYRRMGHEEAPRSPTPRRPRGEAQAEAGTGTYAPDAFSRAPSQRDFIEPF